jgi:hypothetical protein
VFDLCPSFLLRRVLCPYWLLITSHLTPDEFFESGPHIVPPLRPHQQVDGVDIRAWSQQLFHKHLSHETGPPCDEDAASLEESRYVRGRTHYAVFFASGFFRDALRFLVPCEQQKPVVRLVFCDPLSSLSWTWSVLKYYQIETLNYSYFPVVQSDQRVNWYWYGTVPHCVVI